MKAREADSRAQARGGQRRARRAGRGHAGRGALAHRGHRGHGQGDARRDRAFRRRAAGRDRQPRRACGWSPTCRRTRSAWSPRRPGPRSRSPRSTSALAGRLAGVAPRSDPETRRTPFYVELERPPADLRAGLLVRVSVFAPGQAGEIWLPVTAVLLKEGGKRIVYVEYEPGRFVPREVEVADERGGKVRVLQRPAAGRARGDAGRAAGRPRSRAAPLADAATG